MDEVRRIIFKLPNHKVQGENKIPIEAFKGLDKDNFEELYGIICDYWLNEEMDSGHTRIS